MCGVSSASSSGRLVLCVPCFLHLSLAESPKKSFFGGRGPSKCVQTLSFFENQLHHAVGADGGQEVVLVAIVVVVVVVVVVRSATPPVLQPSERKRSYIIEIIQNVFKNFISKSNHFRVGSAIPIPLVGARC